MSEQREQVNPAPAGSRRADAHPAPDRSFRGRVRRFRRRVRARPRLNAVWRVGIGFIGTVVLVLGVIAIPYPGPGWLIVFAGLGILASEFTWAKRLLHYLRGYYDRWSEWVRTQHVAVQLLLAALTGLVVVVTVWLLGGFGLLARVLGLGHWTWLQSPIM